MHIPGGRPGSEVDFSLGYAELTVVGNVSQTEIFLKLLPLICIEIDFFVVVFFPRHFSHPEIFYSVIYSNYQNITRAGAGCL